MTTYINTYDVKRTWSHISVAFRLNYVWVSKMNFVEMGGEKKNRQNLSRDTSIDNKKTLKVAKFVQCRFLFKSILSVSRLIRRKNDNLFNEINSEMFIFYWRCIHFVKFLIFSMKWRAPFQHWLVKCFWFKRRKNQISLHFLMSLFAITTAEV